LVEHRHWQEPEQQVARHEILQQPCGAVQRPDDHAA
jgi:hypothetical protein